MVSGPDADGIAVVALRLPWWLAVIRSRRVSYYGLVTR
jgi:hypothetical protein